MTAHDSNTRQALPDDAWEADTRRILARIDDAPKPTDEEYNSLLALALQAPTN